MQDAFAIEKNAIGNWTEIGYSAPGVKNNASSYSSANFGYSGADIATGGQASGSVANAWQAKALVKLNDCAVGGTWSLAAEYVSNSTDATKDASVKITASGSSSNCTGLTPAFANLASGR